MLFYKHNSSIATLYLQRPLQCYFQHCPLQVVCSFSRDIRLFDMDDRKGCSPHICKHNGIQSALSLVDIF